MSASVCGPVEPERALRLANDREFPQTLHLCQLAAIGRSQRDLLIENTRTLPAHVVEKDKSVVGPILGIVVSLTSPVTRPSIDGWDRRFDRGGKSCSGSSPINPRGGSSSSTRPRILISP